MKKNKKEEIINGIMSVYCQYAYEGLSEAEFKKDFEAQIRGADKYLKELNGGVGAFKGFMKEFNKAALDFCFELQEQGFADPFKILKLVSTKGTYLKLHTSPGMSVINETMSIGGYKFENKDLSKFDFKLRFEGKVKFHSCIFPAPEPEGVSSRVRAWIKSCDVIKCKGVKEFLEEPEPSVKMKGRSGNMRSYDEGRGE